MAQTIAELTQEREQLLKEIETQAQQISTDRTGEPKAHSLQDWLTAAEKVIPDEPFASNLPPELTASKSVGQSPPQKNNSLPPFGSRSKNRVKTQQTPDQKGQDEMMKAKSNKINFFGVIILLSLLLTILGVSFIAYTSINKELQTVMDLKQETVTQIEALKVAVEKIQGKTGPNGTSVDALAELRARVEALESNVVAGQGAEGAEEASLISSSSPNRLESIMADHAKSMESKFDQLIIQLAKANGIDVTRLQTPPQDTAQQSLQTTQSVSIGAPIEPTSPSVKPLDQPVVRLVDKLPTHSISGPKSPSAPLANYSTDVQWLIKQPAFNFTLQLASMDSRSSIVKMMEENNIRDAKIIPQTKGGNTRFVLLTGSHDSKLEANRVARQFKSDLNISPWVRKVKDLTKRIE